MCSDTFNRMTTPSDSTGDLRTIFVRHFQSLALTHNAHLDDKIHYCRTGELKSEWPFRPKFPMRDRERDDSIERLENWKIQLPAFDGLSDVEFAKAAIESTLLLRPRILGGDHES